MARINKKLKRKGDLFKRSVTPKGLPFPINVLKNPLYAVGYSPRRQKLAMPTKPVELIRRIKSDRLPLHGLRSLMESRFRKKSSKFADVTLINRVQPNVRQTVCNKRHLKRKMLFMIGIAGKGKRLSPGRKNHYRRNSQSEIKCRR